MTSTRSSRRCAATAPTTRSTTSTSSPADVAAGLGGVPEGVLVKRTTRRKVINGVLYGILALTVVLLGALVNWGAVKANFFDPAGWKRGGNWEDLIRTGVKNTVVYTVIAFALGFALAILLALMKLSPVAPYRWLATGYIEFFRGLPALIVILVMAFGVPIAFGWSPPGGLVGAGLIGLILVAGAYMAETLRAGIQAVPKGQTEAARSLGMSAGRTTVSVVLPRPCGSSSRR